jgi:hypothetical protein
MSIIFGIDSAVIILVAGIVIVLCIVVGFIVKKSRSAKSAKLHKITEDPSRIPLRVQKIPVNATVISPGQDAVVPAAPQPKEINCIHGMTDISQSLIALAEKYSLDEITLATSDGLLLASSSKKPAADDIARYCGIYITNPRARSPGILLFGVEHKGSSIVGIAKTKGPDLQEPGQDLIDETKDILNWWI